MTNLAKFLSDDAGAATIDWVILVKDAAASAVKRNSLSRKTLGQCGVCNLPDVAVHSAEN